MKLNGDRLGDAFHVRLTKDCEDFVRSQAKVYGVSPTTFIRMFIIENMSEGGKEDAVMAKKISRLIQKIDRAEEAEKDELNCEESFQSQPEKTYAYD